MSTKAEDGIVRDDTCFAARRKHKSACPMTECRYWISDPDEVFNCSLLAATRGGMTLEQIGRVFGLTRMRVCQIEKNIYKKISEQLTKNRPIS